MSLALIGLMVAAKIALVAARAPFDVRLTWIALAGCAPLLVASRRRFALVRRIDWSTLAFFTALFVLMAAVWRSGFLQSVLRLGDSASVPRILGLSVVGSQVVSNVPFVALSLPLIGGPGASPAALLALAAGSTIAGNCLVLGAASNVIIIQAAETEGATIPFLDFARVGIPLTVVQVAVYAAALLLRI